MTNPLHLHLHSTPKSGIWIERDCRYTARPSRFSILPSTLPNVFLTSDLTRSVTLTHICIVPRSPQLQVAIGKDPKLFSPSGNVFSAPRNFCGEVGALLRGHVSHVVHAIPFVQDLRPDIRTAYNRNNFTTYNISTGRNSFCNWYKKLL